MKNISIMLVAMIALFVEAIERAHAVSPDECEQQRANYPKDWNDVSSQKVLFDCTSRYAGGVRIKLGPTDDKGRTLMSLVPLKRNESSSIVETSSPRIYRIWLDQDQISRLKEGRYFATVLRKEGSCWVRGNLDDDPIFLMDNTNAPSDHEGSGPFYNKAPRISAFEGNSYDCVPAQ